MGQQAGIAEGRSACRRQRVLQHKIHRRFDQRIDGMACDHFDRFAERRPLAALAALGARVLVNVTEQFSVLGGIFDGNPGWSGTGRSPVARSIWRQLPDQRSAPPLGTASVRLGTTRRGIPTSPGKSSSAAGGTSVLFRTNDTHRTEFRWRRPAVAASPPAVRRHRGLGGPRATNLPSAHSDDRGIGVFGRISGAPADRNLIDLYADAGFEFIGLSEKRPDDKVGHRSRLRTHFQESATTRQRLSQFRKRHLAATLVRRIADSGLPISDPGRVDVAAELPVHNPSRRRRDKPVGRFCWPTAKGCHGIRAQNDLEVLALKSVPGHWTTALVGIFLARMARVADPAGMAALNMLPLSMITTFGVPPALISYFILGAHVLQQRVRA